MIALPLVLYAAAAALLFRWLRESGGSRSERLRWSLAWAPAFAYGLPSCALFAARWCGFDGALPWGLTLLVLVGGLALAARRGGPRAPMTPLAAPPPRRHSLSFSDGVRGVHLVTIASAALLLVTGGLLIGSLRTWQRAQPAGMWDAVAIWNTSARFLARADAGRLPELIGAMREGHPRYPLLLGAAVAAQWELAGNESSAVPLGIGLGFALGLAAALHLMVRLAGAPLFAGPAVLLVFSTPIVWKWAFAQVADLALAYLLLAAALPLVAVLQGKAACGVTLVPSAVFAGFVLGLLPWTKDEGAVLAATLAGLFGVLFVGLGGGLAAALGRGRPRGVDRYRRRPWDGASRQLAAFALGALPGVGALFLFKLSWAPPLPAGQSFVRGGAKAEQLFDIQRWRYVAREVWRAIDPRTGDALWGFAWALLALGVLFWGSRLRWRETPGAVFLLAAATLLSAEYVLAFVLSPYDLAWHVPAALDRLMLHVLPLLAAGVFALAGTGLARVRGRPAVE